MGNIPSPESIRKGTLARTGKKRGPMMDEQKEKLRSVQKGKVAWAYQWKVIGPDKEEYVTLNLKKFCREHNLNQGNMYQVAKGKKDSDKGWTCHKVSKDRHIPERD